jgi:flagellar biosynthetic protein FliQ
MMNQGTVLDIGREALLVTATIAGPLLLVALVIGLLIGIVQAATSINEMTLSFIPKLVCLVLVLYLFGSWQLTVLTDFAKRLIERIPGIIG